MKAKFINKNPQVSGFEIGKDDVIVLYMSDRFDDVLSKNKDIIEITKREFEEINV